MERAAPALPLGHRAVVVAGLRVQALAGVPLRLPLEDCLLGHILVKLLATHTTSVGAAEVLT